MAELHLRAWQADALARLAGHGRRDFLTVATPGAGKTTFALAAMIRHLHRYPDRQLVVVVPTRHLKQQWRSAAARLGVALHLTLARHGGLPRDAHGVVVTYQQVASDPKAWPSRVWRTFVVLDEVHHAGTDRSWGDALHDAFVSAPARLSLSGTPFRSDRAAIPFLTYTAAGQAAADVSYGYRDALADGVVRPVAFRRVGGDTSWLDHTGTGLQASFEDPLGKAATSQRLRTALDPSGGWLTDVLGRADRHLSDVRTDVPDAGGLVVARDQASARAITRLLAARVGTGEVTLVSSDVPDASSKIERFAVGSSRWLVAVRMVSEGVDVPRLRVGVWATTTTTELFFRQAVGRLLRATGDGGAATMFLPDDPRLRALAGRFGDDQDVWSHLAGSGGDDAGWDEVVARTCRADPQLSLFEAVAATASEEHELCLPGGRPAAPARMVTMELTPPPLPDGRVLVPATADVVSGLRRDNHDRASRLSRRLGVPPAQVHASLNRHVGISAVGDASAEQLRARLTVADRWLSDS